MESLLEGKAFICLWIGFLVLMSLVVGAIFFWGVRNRQFQNQDRARYLALDDEIPEEQADKDKRRARQ